MKILVAGDWYSEVHETGVQQAYEQLGHEVFRFSWYQYFVPRSRPFALTSALEKFSCKFQDKFILGPKIYAINRDFIDAVDKCRPDVISLYRGTHITGSTLRRIKAAHPSVRLVCHNEDDPFTEGHPYWLWRHFLASVPEYDLVLAHRMRNVAQYRQLGARNVRFLRSWFAPRRIYPITLTAEDRLRFDCDAVFAGHYENDGRVEFLEEIVKDGFKLRLFGPGKYWDPVLRDRPLLRHLIPVEQVWGENHNKALCGAKVALCFFSRLNRDTYTRRCFEVPATRTLLLSEYTDDLASLYRAGVEADFFNSKEELMQKLRLYVGDDARRASVAQAGYDRVVADGHDVVSRMKQVLQWVDEIRVNQRADHAV